MKHSEARYIENNHIPRC